MMPMRLLACCLMAVALVAPVAVLAQTVKMLDAAACSQAPLRIEWTKPKGQIMHLVITEAHTPQKPVTLPVENGDVTNPAESIQLVDDRVKGVVYFDSVTRNAAIKEGEYFVGLAKDGAGMFGAEKWSSAFIKIKYRKVDDPECAKAHPYNFERIHLNINLVKAGGIVNLIVSHLAISQLKAKVLLKTSALAPAGFKLDMSIKTVGTPQARGLGLMAYVKATTGWEDSEGLCPITANVNDGPELGYMTFSQTAANGPMKVEAGTRLQETDFALTFGDFKDCSVSALKAADTTAATGNVVKKLVISSLPDTIAGIFRSLAGYIAADPCFQKNLFAPAPTAHKEMELEVDLQMLSDIPKLAVQIKSALIGTILGQGASPDLFNVDLSLTPTAAAADAYAPDISLDVSTPTDMINSLWVKLAEPGITEQKSAAINRFGIFITTAAAAFADKRFTDALSAVGPDNPFWTWAAPPKQNWVMSWFVANPAPPAAEHPVPVLAANAADERCKAVSNSRLSKLEHYNEEWGRYPEKDLKYNALMTSVTLAEVASSTEVVSSTTDQVTVQHQLQAEHGLVSTAEKKHTVQRHKTQAHAKSLARSHTRALAHSKLRLGDRWKTPFLKGKELTLPTYGQFYITEMQLEHMHVEFHSAALDVMAQTQDYNLRLGDKADPKGFSLVMHLLLSNQAPAAVEGAPKPADEEKKKDPKTDKTLTIILSLPKDLPLAVLKIQRFIARHRKIEYSLDMNKDIVNKLHLDIDQKTDAKNPVLQPFAKMGDVLSNAKSGLVALLKGVIGPMVADMVGAYLSNVVKQTISHPCLLQGFTMDSIAVSHTPPAGVMSALMANQRLTVGFKAKGAMPQVFRNMVEGQLRSKTISASVRYSGARSTLELVLEATPSAQSSTLAREFRRFVAGLATLSGTLDHDAGFKTLSGAGSVLSELFAGKSEAGKVFWEMVMQGKPDFEPVVLYHSSPFYKLQCEAYQLDSFIKSESCCANDQQKTLFSRKLGFMEMRREFVGRADQLEDLLEDIRQLEELLKEVGKGGAPTPAAPPAKGRKKSLQSPLDALRSINKALRTSKDKDKERLQADRAKMLAEAKASDALGESIEARKLIARFIVHRMKELSIALQDPNIDPAQFEVTSVDPIPDTEEERAVAAKAVNPTKADLKQLKRDSKYACFSSSGQLVRGQCMKKEECDVRKKKVLDKDVAGCSKKLVCCTDNE